MASPRGKLAPPLSFLGLCCRVMHIEGGTIVRGQQTNLKLTRKGRARLFKLAKLTRRSPWDVIEILVAQARVRDKPDIVLVGTVALGEALGQTGPDDAA